MKSQNRNNQYSNIPQLFTQEDLDALEDENQEVEQHLKREVEEKRNQIHLNQAQKMALLARPKPKTEEEIRERAEETKERRRPALLALQARDIHRYKQARRRATIRAEEVKQADPLQRELDNLENEYINYTATLQRQREELKEFQKGAAVRTRPTVTTQDFKIGCQQARNNVMQLSNELKYYIRQLRAQYEEKAFLQRSLLRVAAAGDITGSINQEITAMSPGVGAGTVMGVDDTIQTSTLSQRNSSTNKSTLLQECPRECYENTSSTIQSKLPQTQTTPTSIRFTTMKDTGVQVTAQQTKIIQSEIDAIKANIQQLYNQIEFLDQQKEQLLQTMEQQTFLCAQERGKCKKSVSQLQIYKKIQELKKDDYANKYNDDINRLISQIQLKIQEALIPPDIKSNLDNMALYEQKNIIESANMKLKKLLQEASVIAKHCQKRLHIFIAEKRPVRDYIQQLIRDANDKKIDLLDLLYERRKEIFQFTQDKALR